MNDISGIVECVHRRIDPQLNLDRLAGRGKHRLFRLLQDHILSILFLLLGAPDIAITQVVVEVIVVTALIRLVGRTGGAEEKSRGAHGIGTVLVGVAALLLLLGVTTYAFAALPAFGDPRMSVSRWYLENGPGLTGASNVVMAILLDFRAYDTLGEATVILAAIVGAAMVLRRPARKTPGENTNG